MFSVALAIIFMVLIIIVGVLLDIKGETMIILLFTAIIGSLLIPDVLFDKNYVWEDECESSYELVVSDYITPQSSRSGIVVSYVDEDGILNKYNANKCRVIYYDGAPKIEFVKVTWGFLYETKAIIYLNE